MGLINSLPNESSNPGLAEWSEVYANDNRLRQEIDGELDNANLAADAEIAGTKLASAFLEDVGVSGTGATRRGVTSIATEETTTSTSYTTLATPDQVASVVLPSNGLIFVMYRALWKLTGATNSGSAAIFLGGNQLKLGAVNQAPQVVEETLSAGGDNYGLITTHPTTSTALDSSPSDASDSSFVTTGQTAEGWAPLAIEAAAGSYTVSVRFHVNAAAGGTLSVKERKLWVWTAGF